jgi:hypothetical protein
MAKLSIIDATLISINHGLAIHYWQVLDVA